MATLNDITFYKGEAVALVFTMTPVTNIAGWNISLTLRNNPTDAVPLLTKAATLTTPAAGVFTVALTHAETVALSAANYAYDVQRTDTGSEAVLSIGTLVVAQEVLYP
jgi:hypothetical protein